MGCTPADYADSAGRNFLVLREDSEGSGTYTELFATVDDSLSMANPSIDVSNKSAGVDRLTIPGGTKTRDLSGTGIITGNSSGYKWLEDLYDADDNSWSFQIVSLATGRARTGCFRLTQLDPTGAHDGRQEFSYTLESTGSDVVSAYP